MKARLLAVGLYVFILMISCDPSQEINPSDAELDRYKEVGEQIPFSVGMRWMDFFRSQRTGARVSALPMTLSASEVNKHLSSPETLGFAFHYAYDEFDQLRLLVIPVNHSLNLWSDFTGKEIIDATTGLAVPKDLAKSWAAAYRHVNPNEVYFHFFGTGVFAEMTKLPFFREVEIAFATDDSSLKPQLLLIIWNDETEAGRSASDAAVVYDASSPCPPCNMEY